MLTYMGKMGRNDGLPDVSDYGRVNMKLVDIVRTLRGIPANIIITAWEKLAEVVAPTGEKYTRAQPLIREKVADNVCGLCDVVGRIVISDKEENKGERFIVLSGATTIVAKDRLRKRAYCKFEELMSA
jgi:phage nucleotide-binding protein